MLVFKRPKKNEVGPESKQQHVLFQQWENVKIKFAYYLQQRSELLSLKSKQVMLLLFVLAFTSGCISLIVNATVDNKSRIGFKQISNPSTKGIEGITTNLDSIITQKDYRKIEMYKSYLLQLRDDSVNRKKFDSIMLLRPHLLDSITLFEKMYLSQ